MSATFCRVVNGGALVTACKVVTAVSLSANNVGFGAGVTLSWSGAAGGAGNPIRGYEVYRDGVLHTTVFDGTSCTVTSPTSNGSYKFTVKTLGRISGFDSGISTAAATLTSVVTNPTAPTSVWLSETDVRMGNWVTLYWSGAQGGTNNPIASYTVVDCTDGAWDKITSTTSTSLSVASFNTAGAKRSFAVLSVGTVSGTWSPGSKSVTLTSHGAEYVDYYFTSSSTFTIPSWYEACHITLISGGGSGSGGVSGHGGNGGGSGWVATYTITNDVGPGPNYTVTVGAGGASTNARCGSYGGTSSFAGNWSCNGGEPGNLDGQGRYGYGRGGHGGAGGGGGGAATNAGNQSLSGAGGNGYNTSGGEGYGGVYGVSGGTGGGYYGTNGVTGKGNTWGGSNEAAGVGCNCNDYYCFLDPATKRYLNAKGGDGGFSNKGDTPSGGGWGGRPGNDYGGTPLSGTGYGAGGNGANNDYHQSSSEQYSWAGGSGLVAIRVGRYLS